MSIFVMFLVAVGALVLVRTLVGDGRRRPYGRHDSDTPLWHQTHHNGMAPGSSETLAAGLLHNDSNSGSGTDFGSSDTGSSDSGGGCDAGGSDGGGGGSTGGDTST